MPFLNQRKYEQQIKIFENRFREKNHCIRTYIIKYVIRNDFQIFKVIRVLLLYHYSTTKQDENENMAIK